MQRLLNAVTSLPVALSMALYVVPPFAPLPAMAQATTGDVSAPLDLPEGAFTVDLDGKTVICLPAKTTVCPDGAFCVIAKVPAGCKKKAVAKLALEGGDAVPDTAQAGDAAPADQAAAEQAAAEQSAADQAAADTAAKEQAAADQAASDQAAADKAAADQLAKEQAAADQAVADQVAADKAAQDQAAADQAAADQAAADQAAADKAAADQAAAAEQLAPAKTEPAPAETSTATADSTEIADAAQTPIPITVRGQVVICLPLDKSVICPEGSVCVRAKSPARCEAVALKRLDQLAAAAAEDAAAIKAAKEASDAAAKAAEAAGQPLVDAPKPTEDAVKSLDTVIAATPADPGATAVPDAPVAAAAAAPDVTPTDGKTPADAAPAPDAVVTEQKVTASDTRASSQEFAAAPAATADGKKKTGLSDLERAGLFALGALAIGQMLYGNNGGANQVVSNSGDRVVVKDQSGNYQVYKDDDVLLRQPGATVRTETFNDGSTRTTVARDDGTSVVTIRDASGRVLRRSAYDARGIETLLIDDTIPETRVDVTRLPPPAIDPAVVEANVRAYAHQFSLRQVRTIPEVKALAPLIPVDNVRFATGSAAIQPAQAQNLADLARVMRFGISKNPAKVYLIEGHTDAVGGAPQNLLLSDRRAESVAKALSEYYGLPPENMVVQGYGESELLVDSQGSEPANRRVAVRDITYLLRQTAQN